MNKEKKIELKSKQTRSSAARGPDPSHPPIINSFPAAKVAVCPFLLGGCIPPVSTSLHSDKSVQIWCEFILS